MDEALKKYWKIFVPVTARIIERNTQTHNDDLNRLFGISSIHIRYILILDTGKYTLKELSECLFFNKANTTRAISSLRALGYVTDDRTSADSRKYKIFLTPEGINVLEYLKKEMNSEMDVFFEGISDEDFKNCLNVIKQICINIDKSGQYIQILKKLNDAVINDSEPPVLKDMVNDI